MSSPPYIPFFVEDYIGDTIDLSIEEHGAYFLLMLAAWKQDDCSLPDNNRKLARICRVTTHKWRQIRETMEEFWTVENGRWTNNRLQKERAYVEKRSAAARENANKRWGSQDAENIESDECDGNAGADAIGDARSDAPHTLHTLETNVSKDAGASETNPIDMVKAVFDSGVSVLTQSGHTERQARAQLGLWRQTYTDSIVLTVLARAQEHKPSDPIPWITQGLKLEARKAAGKSNGTGNRIGDAATAEGERRRQARGNSQPSGADRRRDDGQADHARQVALARPAGDRT